MSNTPETDHLETELGQTALQAHPVIWKNSRKLERERDEAREKLRLLEQAALAVVQRWEQPSWKDVEPTAAVINKLRNALEVEEE
jgi:hypothetical protein